MSRWNKRSIEAEVEIDGFRLFWSLRSEPKQTSDGDAGLSIEVRRTDGTFRELILEYVYPKRGTPRWTLPPRPKVSAKKVEADIRKAVTAGWEPASRGKPFVFQVPENSN